MSHLTLAQRYTISCMFKENYSQSDIAKAIGKHKSVVCREIKRNCDKRNGSYNHDLAQRKYEKRNKGKPKKIRFTDDKKRLIDKLLKDKYSPEQISGHCKREGVDMVSHERIYQYVWQDKKQGGKLYVHLRTRGKRYRKRGNMKDSRGIIKDRVCISNRPQIVEEKQRFGDLEIDTIIGKNHKGAIVTINDRATGLLKMKSWIQVTNATFWLNISIGDSKLNLFLGLLLISCSID